MRVDLVHGLKGATGPTFAASAKDTLFASTSGRLPPILTTALSLAEDTFLKPEQGRVGGKPNPEKTIQAEQACIGEMKSSGNR